MSKDFPDCPIWLRITDQEKSLTNISHHRTEKNHEWTDKEKMLLVKMKAEGKSNREIAATVGCNVSINACKLTYHRMEELGKLEQYERLMEAF
jgi:hypothetical protein